MPELPSPQLITLPRELAALCNTLHHESQIAFDTESNSLHAYFERVCLIQVSTRTADYIIDPIFLEDIGGKAAFEPLGRIFADFTIEKVFHAAEYDLMCLKRDYQFHFANVFDTMMAARVLGRKQIGLGAFLSELYGVETSKHFQKANWAERPIPPDQLHYAQLDTHYLLGIRDFLYQELAAQESLEEATELFEIGTRVSPAAPHHNPLDGYWNFHAAKQFKPRQMAVLRELYELRDQIARQQNTPPFKIMTEQVMIGLVTTMPVSERDLLRVREISGSFVRRHADDIFAALDRGLQAVPPKRPPRPLPPPPEVQARYDALQNWRREMALIRGVESDIILSKETIWHLATHPPTHESELEHVPGFGAWRREKYGSQVLAVLRSTS
jgi:ribonuclease D